jgi:hypothetical protein
VLKRLAGASRILTNVAENQRNDAKNQVCRPERECFFSGRPRTLKIGKSEIELKKVPTWMAKAIEAEYQDSFHVATEPDGSASGFGVQSVSIKISENLEPQKLDLD